MHLVSSLKNLNGEILCYPRGFYWKILLEIFYFYSIFHFCFIFRFLFLFAIRGLVVAVLYFYILFSLFYLSNFHFISSYFKLIYLLIGLIAFSFYLLISLLFLLSCLLLKFKLSKLKEKKTYPWTDTDINLSISTYKFSIISFDSSRYIWCSDTKNVMSLSEKRTYIFYVKEKKIVCIKFIFL